MPEEFSDDHPHLAQIGERETEHHAELSEQYSQRPHLSKSPGEVSAFSGTTARTSRSAEEMLNPSLEDTLDAIEEISRCSEKILRYLVPPQISEVTVTALMINLQAKGSRLNQNLKRLNDMLSIQRERLGNNQYIANQEIVESLLREHPVPDDEAARCRPDALLLRANLAELASKMFSCSWQDTDDIFIEESEQAFPSFFVTKFVPSENQNFEAGSCGMIRETSQLALELRTQYAIILLDRHADQPNFDSDVILQKVFYKDAKNLRGWTSIPMLMEDLVNETQSATVTRLESLREAFAISSDDVRMSIEHLRTSFPWITFVQQFATWIKQRLTELNDQVARYGGLEAILQALSDQAQSVRFNTSSAANEKANDDDHGQIILSYDFPSEASLAVAQPQNRSKFGGMKTLKLGLFK